MDRVGGPVGCSTARIGCWKLLGLQEIASQDYRHVTTCAIVRDIQKGVGLNWATFIQLERKVSGMTLVSKLRTELVVGGVMIRLTTRRRRQCSNVDPSRGKGIRKGRELCGKDYYAAIIPCTLTISLL
jgi:hypothetical protein